MHHPISYPVSEDAVLADVVPIYRIGQAATDKKTVTVQSIVDLAIIPVPLEIAGTAFADVNNPTNAEVDVWLAGQTTVGGQIYYYGNTSTDPDYIWTVLDDGTGVSVKTPTEPSEIPATAFVDVNNPTSTEVDGYLATITVEGGQMFYYGGTVSEPDYVWTVLSDGTSVRIITSSAPAAIPATAFVDANDPTTAEVDVYIATQTTVAGQLFYYGNTAADPNFVWSVLDDGTSSNIKKPEAPNPIEIPATAFADVNNPTSAEVDTYFTTITPITGQLYYYGNTSTNPDYIWSSLDDDTSVVVKQPMPPILIPSSAFADTIHPTSAEVDVYIATQTIIAGQLYYYGNALGDEYIWAVRDDGTSIVVKTPDTSNRRVYTSNPTGLTIGDLVVPDDTAGGSWERATGTHVATGFVIDGNASYFVVLTDGLHDVVHGYDPTKYFYVSAADPAVLSATENGTWVLKAIGTTALQVRFVS